MMIVRGRFFSGLLFNIILNFLMAFTLIHLNQMVLNLIRSVNILFNATILRYSKKSSDLLFRPVAIEPMDSLQIRFYESDLYFDYFRLRLFHILDLDYSYLLNSTIIVVTYVFFIVQTSVDGG